MMTILHVKYCYYYFVIDFQDSDNVDNKDVSTLKDFDLNWRYGPCKGISLLECLRADLHVKKVHLGNN